MSTREVTRPKIVDPGFDPGLTQRYASGLKRIINPDGRFNVRRTGGTWRDFNPYLFLINSRWPVFILFILLEFTLVNTIFTTVYLALGPEHVKNAQAPTAAQTFLNLFFFSFDTLTTIGYGNMWPSGAPANITAALEALAGFISFALVTGLIFGRFARPSARFGFSNHALITPYQGRTSLQFRTVNRRSNNVINVEARILLMTVEVCSKNLQRKYTPLNLERPSVLFFPLTWTVVHPIDESSPLYGKTANDLEKLQAELLIIVQGFDDTFGQTVHARYSYRYDEIVWGARFSTAFAVEENGDLRVDLDKIGLTEPAPLPDPDPLTTTA